MRLSRVTPGIILWCFVFILLGLCSEFEARRDEPRGEIRIVESWRPDITVLGHNVLQCLFEYAIDKNEMVPALAVSRVWIDDYALGLKRREGAWDL